MLCQISNLEVSDNIRRCISTDGIGQDVQFPLRAIEIDYVLLLKRKLQKN